jgi:hypothetical protein
MSYYENTKSPKDRGEFVDVFGDIDGKCDTLLSHPLVGLFTRRKAASYTSHITLNNDQFDQSETF